MSSKMTRPTVVSIQPSTTSSRLVPHHRPLAAHAMRIFSMRSAPSANGASEIAVGAEHFDRRSVGLQVSVVLAAERSSS
jgi:hypothetical protein